MMFTMENYTTFLERINAFEKPVMTLPCEPFSVNPSLKNKVNNSNLFNPFFGDTIVFDICKNDKEKIGTIVDTLYREVPECFCEKLAGNTFHVTLHDLCNSTSLDEIAAEICRNEEKLSELFPAKRSVSEKIVFKTNFIINMVGTSLVLALQPKTEKDYQTLMELYCTADEVKTLPYPLTPHITLAYYNINGFSAESAKNLCRTVNELNKSVFELEVDTQALYYTKFTDMNNYDYILPLSL